MSSAAVMQRGLTSDELCDRAGITYRMLDYWCRQGVFDCMGTATPGSGGQRRFARAEVRVAATIARLSEVGARGQVLRLVAPMLRAMPAEEWHGALLVSRAGIVEHVRHGAPITFGEACWIVNLDLCAMRAA